MTHPTDTHVGGRIRQRRWLMQMTQEDLANRVGVKFQQIQKYETGANRVSASRLHDIATVMKVPVSWFFDGLAAEDSQAEEQIASREEADLLSAFRAASAETRQSILNIARAVAVVQPA